MVAGFRGFQVAFETLPFPAGVGVADLAFDRRRQAAEIVLHHVLIRAGAHRFDRPRFADRPGVDDERQISVPLPQQAERLEAAESGKLVIGDDRRPRSLVQRTEVLVPRCDHPFLECQSVALQSGNGQLGVVFRILKEQEAHGRSSPDRVEPYSA